MTSSDAQGMGRAGETWWRTFALASVMSDDGGADDNDRILRYLAKVTIEPAITHGISHEVGSLSPGETARIRYGTLVGVDAKPGPQDTQLTASAQSPLGPCLAAVPVQVKVIVLPSSFSIGQIAIGRVFEDLNDNGEVDKGEPGLAGVRVMLPTGEAAITALTPTTASKVWLRQPSAQPRPNTMPWRRPFEMPMPSTIRLSGPGETVMSSAAARKPKNCSGVSMAA